MLHRIEQPATRTVSCLWSFCARGDDYPDGLKFKCLPICRSSYVHLQHYHSRSFAFSFHYIFRFTFTSSRNLIPSIMITDFHMRMSFHSPGNKVIFMWKVFHSDLAWNKGKWQLWNGILHFSPFPFPPIPPLAFAFAFTISPVAFAYVARKLRIDVRCYEKAGSQCSQTNCPLSLPQILLEVTWLNAVGGQIKRCLQLTT